MDNIFPVWKPIGITSFDVIRKIKRKISNVKIGHCGTLDPFAEGVLVLCTGKLTKSIDSISSLDKEYLCDFIFGSETDTLDCTGTIIRSDQKNIDMNNIEQVLKSFIGILNQAPPYFAAVKINGVKLYEFARKDIFIKLKPRKVTIKDIKLLNMIENRITVSVKCSKGTYIRSLAKDIAAKAGTFAYVDKLSRLSVGEYNSNNCIDIDEVIKCLS